MALDNSEFYQRHGDLSYDFDSEHLDFDLAKQEYELIAPYIKICQKVLHLFCGAGRHLKIFSSTEACSIGVDISPFLLEKAYAMLKKNEYCRNSSLICADVMHLPLNPDTFDCITALGNSICLLDNHQIDYVFRQASSILGDSGILVLDMPDFKFVLNQDKFIRNNVVLKKSFHSDRYGPGIFTWKRKFDPVLQKIFSYETLEFQKSGAKTNLIETTFFFNIIYPDQMVQKAKDSGFFLRATIDLEDIRGIYNGMLKKRIFMVFKK